VNHLGPFLLTQLLLDALPRGARIVNLASTAHTRGEFNFTDMEMRRGYGFWEAYARSKLANVLFTYALARRLEGSGRTVNCLHPGVLPTGIAGGYSPWITRIWHIIRGFYRPVSEGVDAVRRVALDPGLDGVNGRYFYHRELAESSVLSRDQALQEQLWEWSEAAVGLGATGDSI
jgi:NAD(P)-dependent dehydrogenase (short-subunit alcohol dehydrogenase family)